MHFNVYKGLNKVYVGGEYLSRIIMVDIHVIIGSEMDC